MTVSQSLADKIIYLLLNPEKAKKMALNGRYKVMKFYDWQKNVSEMIALYEQIIESNEENS